MTEDTQELPNGVQREWFDLARRLQLAARQANGPAVISIQILVGDRYLPAAWSEPNIVKLEPRLRANDAMIGIARKLSQNVDDERG